MKVENNSQKTTTVYLPFIKGILELIRNSTVRTSEQYSEAVLSFEDNSSEIITLNYVFCAKCLFPTTDYV